ncbi:right-handed parallel beta-helix repeat-containing protein [Spirosoma panaciterrae]|uniref:right-handed parallel beta-helix repeat-containing protein n=1 Tax=Spirosoma panaciterrae TaxID=496058 RepID=UPI0003AA6146|nr:right-handed parallel beta-helix repeat-containing protein [Spirosoma panaciterrae]
MRLSICVYLVSVVFCLQSVKAQRTFYVSSAGNDSNNGLSQSAPFQTINKINTLTLQPGDVVLFRRGDTFRGMLTIQNSGNASNPIRVDAYGSGNKPILSGAVPVTGWTNVGSNLWQANCSSCGTVVNGLYSNNVPLPLGRYPNLNTTNKGYLTVQSHQGKTVLVSQQSLSTNWMGGEVVYRPTLWILNRATITQQSGNTLTLDNANADYDITDGWGYFIQNHPSTLDQNGEWYYNPSDKTIRLYNSQDPNSQSVTATVYSQGIRLANASYVVIQNLQVTQDLNIGVYAANLSNATIANLDITNSGEDGMAIHGNGSAVTIENNLIDQVNNNGVEIQAYTGLAFRNNKVRRVALLPGRGKSGDGQYRGIDVNTTTNTTISNNLIDSIGYNGISFSTQTTGLTINQNVISNFLLTKNDGAGIYTFNGYQLSMTNIKVTSNIVYNGFGSSEGTLVGSTFSGVNGIYLDGCVQNVEVSNNTVFNCNGIGIFMIDALNNSVFQNTCFNNAESQLVLSAGGSCAPRNNTITNNILVSKLTKQTVARYESTGNDLGQYGTIDNNYYARPLDDAIKINAAFLDVNTNSSNAFGLKDWQRLYGKDINSKSSPITYKGFTVNTLNGTNRIINSTFTNSASDWYPQSYYNNGKVGWDNTNKIDGGTMQLYFQPASGYKASYAFIFSSIGTIVSGRSYVMKFDAIASANGKTLNTYIRQRNAPAQDLALRVGSVVNTTRQTYEIAFTATQDDADAIVLFQVLEDGESIWLDNISFQEATISRNNPDDLMKLAYNPNVRDTTITLDGNYRDVKNQFYARQITLSPFSSAVLLRELIPDLSPTIVLPQSNFQVSPNNVRNLVVNLFEGNNQPTPGGSVTATIIVPAGYTVAFNNSITNINVSGGNTNPVAVDNNRWTVISSISSQQLTLKMNAGQSIPANGTAVLGFTITRTTANSGSVSNITVSINNDPARAYDGNTLNNVYARIISGQ